MKKRVFRIVVLLLIGLVLVGCFAGSRGSSQGKPAGLFKGIWHGWIAPFALILEIFSSDIRIYEVNNRGFLYDLGYYIAIISGFGSLALFRRKHRD